MAEVESLLSVEGYIIGTVFKNISLREIVIVSTHNGNGFGNQANYKYLKMKFYSLITFIKTSFFVTF